ncbi:MAG TPA: sensor histidine kinase, partial [Bacteroidia bacterium]|nr:sensor histidine kinase [Bacteroidia bacterium]
AEKYIEKYGGSYDIQDAIENDIELEIDVFSVTIAINNLIENALKYTPKGGVIKVSLEREDNAVALYIADEGPGIPKDERVNVFTKFYRLGSESTRTTKGTGLGLYIVKQITGNHKAEINILENKPKGTVFKISFRPKAA